MRKKTHAEFVEQIKDRPFIAISKYVGNHKKIMLRCTTDGTEWSTSPANILRGTGCPVCGRKQSEKSRAKFNEIISDDGFTLEVDVSTKKHKNAVMLIDKHDYTLIRNKFKYRIAAIKPTKSNTCYATISVNKKKTRIHNLILTDELIVDHENRNGLDNRRSNLRYCTQSQNCMNGSLASNNKTGVTGVCLIKKTGRYMASITYGGVIKRLGNYRTLSEATSVRRDAELKYFGEFTPNKQQGVRS